MSWMGNIGSEVSAGLSWADYGLLCPRESLHSELAYSTQVVFLLIGDCVYHIILYK